ncbi:MAG: cytochrome C biogenesis protein ResB [Thermodesulfovibrio sp.]|nr:cytochrome C biogenesis protein ResB [Thermodesulfovibrio sp.]
MKKIITAMLEFFISLRTAVWLLCGLIFFLFAGGFIMPAHEEFQALHTTPLFTWLGDNAPGVTWWLYGSLIVLSLVAANTLICSIEALIKKKSARAWLLVISPQIIHAGFLFILLAHLLSSYDSFQGMAMAREGEQLSLPGGITMAVDRIHTVMDPRGFIREWAAEVRCSGGGQPAAGGMIRPNEPLFHGGLGLYIKTVKVEPYPLALIQVSRDPGALYALIGGIFFLIGICTLLLLKIRRESPQD